VGPLNARPPRPSLRNQPPSTVVESILYGPLSVSYKGEGGGKNKERELRSRIHVPTRPEPGPHAQPQSLWPSKSQIPRLPRATWAELAPRSPESRHATASRFRHFHPHPPGAASTLASLPRQPY
jgi:hypothetical protein